MGNEHKIVVCGVTSKASKDCPSLVFDEGYIECVAKTLRIGVAICNPVDVYDNEKGELMSYNRAKSEVAIVMTTSRPGMFNTETVGVILNNYLSFIERDPGSVIGGYDESMAKFRETADLRDDANKMSDKDKEILRTIANISPESIEYAKKLIKLKLI